MSSSSSRSRLAFKGSKIGGMRLGFRVPTRSYGNMIDVWYDSASKVVR